MKKGLSGPALFWFFISAILAGLLITTGSYALKAHDRGYVEGYDAGAAHGRRVQLDYESTLMQGMGLCGYAELVCKEKPHGKPHR